MIKIIATSPALHLMSIGKDLLDYLLVGSITRLDLLQESFRDLFKRRFFVWRDSELRVLGHTFASGSLGTCLLDTAGQ